jgi:hypothetical protein
MALDDSTAGVRKVALRARPLVPKTSLEIGSRFSTPDADELRPAVRVSQKHLASEKRLELVQPNEALDEASPVVNVTPLASL